MLLHLCEVKLQILKEDERGNTIVKMFVVLVNLVIVVALATSIIGNII